MANFVNDYVSLNAAAATSFGWDQSYTDGGETTKYSESETYDASYEAYGR